MNMKKKKYILLILIIGLIFPVGVKALTGEVKINCDKTEVIPGDTIECAIAGDFQALTSGIRWNIVVGEGLSLISFEKDSIWDFGQVDGDRIVLSISKSVIGPTNIGKMKIEVLNSSSDKNTQITLDNMAIILEEPDYDEYWCDDVSVDISIKVDNEIPGDNETTGDNETPGDEENNIDNPGTGSLLKIFVIISIVSLLIGVLVYHKKINGGNINEG